MKYINFYLPVIVILVGTILLILLNPTPSYSLVQKCTINIGYSDSLLTEDYAGSTLWFPLYQTRPMKIYSVEVAAPMAGFEVDIKYAWGKDTTTYNYPGFSTLHFDSVYSQSSINIKFEL